MKPVQPVGFAARWATAPIWTIFRRVARRGYESEDLLSVYRDHGVVPRGFTDDNWNRIPDDLTAYQLVQPGDLVLNKMKAWQGSLGLSELRGIVSPAYFVFSPVRGNYDRRFLHHLLRSRPYVDSYGRMSGGIRVDQWDLDPWAFSRLVVPLPPPAEQRAIAYFVDRETAKIDALIEKQNDLIDLLRERRQRTIQQAATLGRRGAETRPSSSWPGFCPLGWSSQRIGWLFGSTSSGTTPQAEEILSAHPGLVPWVNTSELRESVITSTERAVSNETVKAHSALRVYPVGTLLVAMYGATIGRLGILGIEATTNQACCAFVDPRSHLIEPRFIFYSLLAARDELILQSSGGRQPNINQDKLRSLRIPLPALEEQREIVAHLDGETARIDALIAKAGEHMALARERRGALITAAVTGQIDVLREVS